MTASEGDLPYDYVGRPAADLDQCTRPWQIFRRGSSNYCVNLSGPDTAPLVTIRKGRVVRVDPGIAWPEPSVTPTTTIFRSE